MIHSVLYGLLLLGGVVASVLCILHIASVKLNPELHSKCHYVWASWCGAALLLSISAVGRSVQFYCNFTGATEIALCQYCISMSLFGLFATVLWSVALAADRYVAIFHATIYNLPSRLQFYTFSAIMWLFALLLSLMVVPFRRNVPGDTRCIIWFRLTFEAEVAISILYIVLSVSTLSLYAVIVYKTQQSNVKILREKRSSSSNGRINGHLARREMRNRRLLATITLVICFFLISHMVSPVAFIIVGFIDEHALRQETMSILYETLGLLKVMNSIGNLLIFLWRSEDYRTAFRMIVTCKWAELKAGYVMPTGSNSFGKSIHSQSADTHSPVNSSNRLLTTQPQAQDESISDTKL